MEPIADESLKELKIIFEWVKAREDKLEESRTVLVGGWAVYSYNRYWGSIDIDIITNNKTRRSMRKFLLDDHGYHPDVDPDSISVYKDTSAGQVVIDFANRDEDPFEGNHGSLDLGIVDGHTEVRLIGSQEVPVPSRSVLLMMKFKAAWDRNWRYERKLSPDLDWEFSKIIKDYADILALIDPAKGGNEIEIELLGDFFTEHDFIQPVIDLISESHVAADKYNVPSEQAKGFVERFKSMVL